MKNITKEIPKEEFISIYSKVPRLAVDLVIKNKKGVIFTKRSIIPYKGKWHLPGGTVLLNERLSDTAKRIAKKELGLIVKVERVLGHLEYSEKNKSYARHTIAIVILVEVIEGEIILNEEASKVKISKKIPGNFISSQKKFLQPIIKNLF